MSEEAAYLRNSHNIMTCFYLLHDKGSRRSSKDYFPCHGKTKQAKIDVKVR
jgi:hypothetical protein